MPFFFFSSHGVMTQCWRPCALGVFSHAMMKAISRWRHCALTPSRHHHTRSHWQSVHAHVECAPQGSLDHVLNQAAADDVDVSMPVRIAMFLQVADAMVHLDLYKVIHRDLASRTVLAFGLDALDWKAVHIKVTDYGLSLLIDNGFTNAGKSVCRSLHAPCVCSGADAVDGSGVARAPGVLEQERRLGLWRTALGDHHAGLSAL